MDEMYISGQKISYKKIGYALFPKTLKQQKCTNTVCITEGGNQIAYGVYYEFYITLNQGEHELIIVNEYKGLKYVWVLK